jgi:predicted N-acetyltransferase YhbS
MDPVSDIRYQSEITIEDYNALRTAVSWAPVATRLAKLSLANSLFTTIAMADGRPVGMARVVGDGGYILYIADVIVLPDWQRSGIGTRMMEQVMAFIRGFTQPGERVFVNLMAAPGKEPFYAKFGFTERPNDQHGAGMSMYLAGG